MPRKPDIPPDIAEALAALAIRQQADPDSPAEAKIQWFRDINLSYGPRTASVALAIVNGGGSRIGQMQNNYGGQHMSQGNRNTVTAGRDANNVLQGDGTQVANVNTTTQSLRECLGNASLAELVGELERLRFALLGEAKEASHDEAVAAVSAAEEAAKKGDSGGVLASLKKAGKWALDVAVKVGTTLAAKTIEKALEVQTALAN